VTKPESEVGRQIREEIERETRTSRHRDRISGGRVHEIQHDVNQLVHFVATRRQRQPGVFDAARRVCRTIDTEALRFLVALVLGGSSYPAMRRLCARIIGYCETVEAALALKEPGPEIH